MIYRRSSAITGMRGVTLLPHVSTAPIHSASMNSLAGSYKAYLEGVTVARNLPTGEMTAGRKVAVIFFDEHNPREAVVVAVYT